MQFKTSPAHLTCRQFTNYSLPEKEMIRNCLNCIRFSSEDKGSVDYFNNLIKFMGQIARHCFKLRNSSGHVIYVNLAGMTALYNKNQFLLCVIEIYPEQVFQRNAYCHTLLLKQANNISFDICHAMCTPIESGIYNCNPEMVNTVLRYNQKYNNWLTTVYDYNLAKKLYLGKLPNEIEILQTFEKVLNIYAPSKKIYTYSSNTIN